MNSFGRLFRLHIFGESHGSAVGILLDGCPPGLPLCVEDFLPDLERRRPGAAGTTPRREKDVPELTSGVWEGRTSGAPLLIRFANLDVRSGDYDRFRSLPRPGQADFAATRKYSGWNDLRGGGHFSGRLTLGLVAAGVVAKKIIAPVVVAARLLEAGGDADVEAAVARALAERDSIGGLIGCEVPEVPVGLGEPFFDSCESLLSHLLFAIPGIKGIDFGAGFRAARMRGSECNDALLDASGRTASNHGGGIVGGLTNGNAIEFRVAVRPTASIPLPQATVDLETGRPATIEVGGRHDSCFARRVPVVVEAAAAIVLADLLALSGQSPRFISQKDLHSTPGGDS